MIVDGLLLERCNGEGFARSLRLADTVDPLLLLGLRRVCAMKRPAKSNLALLSVPVYPGPGCNQRPTYPDYSIILLESGSGSLRPVTEQISHRPTQTPIDLSYANAVLPDPGGPHNSVTFPNSRPPFFFDAPMVCPLKAASSVARPVETARGPLACKLCNASEAETVGRRSSWVSHK